MAISSLAGILPKAYRGFEPRLLMDLIKNFNRDSLKKASGDVFGKIYEYFLNKFAQTGAQEGGEFFTPPSLVRLIVNIIEPDRGTVFDPACGSGGMFVQTGHFIELQRNAKPHQRVVFHGQEKAETNAHLARMNLAVHGLEGDIRIANSFYDEQPELINRCDFVMANPPFNVDGVNTGQLKKQIGQWEDSADDEAEASRFQSLFPSPTLLRSSTRSSHRFFSKLTPSNDRSNNSNPPATSSSPA